MKKRFHHEDLLYGVLFAAVASFAFATVLDNVHVADFAGSQVHTTRVVAAQSASAVVTTAPAARAAR